MALVRIELSGVAHVTFTRTVAIPEEHLEDLLEDPEQVMDLLVAKNPDTRMTIGSWDYTETEVLE
jgi:hypothetical protein